jgi:2,5-diketo-D-gluconate reductase A
MRATEEHTVDIGAGISMPIVGLGTWALRGPAGRAAVRQALEVGYRHLDTATAYGNEGEVGRAIRESGVPREDVFVTTKLPPERAGPERETIVASLHALDTDYVDLWLIHWPPDGEASPGTWAELISARRDGLVRAIGVSNYPISQIDELTVATGEIPAVNQIRWGPSLHDPRRLLEHRDRGVVLEGYSPFKSTDLRHPTLAKVAKTYGVTPAQVVVRWHVEHRIVVIPKSSRPERVRTNADVFGFSLSAEEVAQIDAMSRR